MNTRRNRDILNFPGVNPEPTLPTLQLNPPRPETSTRLSGIDYFGRTPDFKIDQFLELNRKKNRHLLKPKAFSPDGKLDIDALMSLIHFIENGDSDLAPNLNKAQRLDLVTRLISKFLKFPKPKFDLFDLGKKLVQAKPNEIAKLNSVELRSLENPQQRKNFIQSVLEAVTKASSHDPDKREVHRFSMNNFTDLQRLFSSIKTLAKAA